MIRTEVEYRCSLQRLAEIDAHIAHEAAALKAEGYKKAEVTRGTDPLRFFRAQVQAEIDAYDRLKRGEFNDVFNFRSFGDMLIALRIAKGVTQRELAQRLKVSESQISRDERNCYSGITVDRAQRILEALDAEIKTSVVWKEPVAAPLNTERKSKAKPRGAKAKVKGSRT